MNSIDQVFVVADRFTGCPYGCGVEVVLVKCCGTNRIVGYCWACGVSQPVPLPKGYPFGSKDIERTAYAPFGWDLPSQTDVVATGLEPFVLQVLPLAEWGGAKSLAWHGD